MHHFVDRLISGDVRQFSRRCATERGDTIVEVLIAMAVISTILAATFTTVNQSYTGIRDSQEHAEALSVLQGQVEQLRPLATASSSPIYGSNIFCIDNTGAVQTGFHYSSVPALDSDNFSQYPAACQSVNGTPYNLSIAYDNSSQIFSLRARWDRLQHGRDEVLFFYKLPVLTVSPPSVPDYTNCSDPGITSETYFFNFYNYPPPPSSGDWHVLYNEAGKPVHSIATIPYPSSGSLNIPPGTYEFWAFAKDGHVNPTAFNRSVHYNFYNNSGTMVDKTADTPDITASAPNDPNNPPNGVVSAEAKGTITVPVGQSIATIRVEHSPNVPSIDDSVDAACLGLRALP